MDRVIAMHIGRSWTDHPIEDTCPYPQEPCGLVNHEHASTACEQHRITKTIRQGHHNDECPALVEGERA